MQLGFADIFRLIDLCLFGFVFGVSIKINQNAWALRGRTAGVTGLVPWHILAVTTALFLSYAWNAWEVVSRVGQSYTWRVPLLLIIGILLTIAMRIIYKIQMARFVVSNVLDRVDDLEIQKNKENL